MEVSQIVHECGSPTFPREWLDGSVPATDQWGYLVVLVSLSAALGLRYFVVQLAGIWALGELVLRSHVPTPSPIVPYRTFVRF